MGMCSTEEIIQMQKEHLSSFSQEQRDFLSPRIFGLVKMFDGNLETFYFDFVNMAPLSKYHLAYIHDVITKCEADPLYEIKLSGLKSQMNQFWSLLFEFEILAFLLNSGFDAKWIKETRKSSVPDIEVNLPGGRIYLELISLSISEKEKKATKVSNTIIKSFFCNPKITLSGSLLIVPGEKALDNILKNLKEKMSEAIAKGEMVEYHEEGIIHIAFAPRDSKPAVENLRAWSSANNYSGFTCPSGDVSLNRLKREMTQKLRERIDYCPLVLCVRFPFLFSVSNESEIKNVALELAVSELQNFHNAAGAYLLFTSFIMPAQEAEVLYINPRNSFVKDLVLAHTYGLPLYTETILAFSNPLCQDRMENGFLKGLIDAQLLFLKRYHTNYHAKEF